MGDDNTYIHTPSQRGRFNKIRVDGAIGGDQGGSIRIPASWCGIVGLKPTFGLVPFTGSSSHEYTMDHVGPMAKDTMTCAKMLQAIQGYDHGLDSRQPPHHSYFSKDYITPLKSIDETLGIK